MQTLTVNKMNIKSWLLLVALVMCPLSGAYAAACKGILYECEQTTDTAESGALQQQPGPVEGDIFDDTDSFIDYFSTGDCAGDACGGSDCSMGKCPDYNE